MPHNPTPTVPPEKKKALETAINFLEYAIEKKDECLLTGAVELLAENDPKTVFLEMPPIIKKTRTANEMLIIVSDSHMIYSASPRLLYEMTGYHLWEIQYCPWVLYYYRTERERIIRTVKKTGSFKGIVTGRHKNGLLIPVKLNMTLHGDKFKMILRHSPHFGAGCNFAESPCKKSPERALPGGADW